MSEDTIDFERLLAETFVASFEHHATIGSTNDRAREAAADGLAPLPRLFVADEQTAGRGRGANRWWTGAGSLAMSLLIEPEQLGIRRQQCGLISLASAVAIIDTISPLLRGHLAGLHWPNDVYIGPRKLAGILVEALADGRHIVGIGLNVNNSLREAPAELHHIATTLRDLAEECSPHAPREVSEGGIEATYADGRRSVPAVGAASEASTAGASALALSRDRVLRSLLVQLERAWDALAQAPESLAERFNALCVQQGQAVTLKNGQETVCGVCEGIDADGGLILATPSGRKKFYAGVVAR